MQAKQAIITVPQERGTLTFIFRKRCRARDTVFFPNERFAFAGLCGLSTAVHVETVSVDNHILDRLLDTAGYEPGPLQQVVGPT